MRGIWGHPDDYTGLEVNSITSRYPHARFSFQWEENVRLIRMNMLGHLNPSRNLYQHAGNI